MITRKVKICCSVTVISESLQPHRLQHARPPSWGSSLKLISIESVMPSNHLILCHPLLLLTSIFPSIRVFSNESALCIRWPKYWSFSFSISPSNEYSRLISFRIDWLDLEVQGPSEATDMSEGGLWRTPFSFTSINKVAFLNENRKSLLWHHNLKA